MPMPRLSTFCPLASGAAHRSVAPLGSTNLRLLTQNHDHAARTRPRMRTDDWPKREVLDWLLPKGSGHLLEIWDDVSIARHRRRPLRAAHSPAKIWPMRSSAFARVRTRSRGSTWPSRTSSSGLKLSNVPSMACARPMRPPRCKNSKVSRTAIRRIRARRLSACAFSSARPLRLLRLTGDDLGRQTEAAAHRTRIQHLDGHPGRLGHVRAAGTEVCIVPLRLWLMCIARMPVAPSAMSLW